MCTNSTKEDIITVIHSIYNEIFFCQLDLLLYCDVLMSFTHFKALKCRKINLEINFSNYGHKC